VKKQIEATLGKLPPGQRHFDDQRSLPHHGEPGSWDLKMDKEQAVLVIGFRTVGAAQRRQLCAEHDRRSLQRHGQPLVQPHS